MNLELKYEIKKKADDLIKKAKILPNIPIKWEKKILINCSELNGLKKLKDSTALSIFENNKKQPAIYYFKITSKHDGKSILSEFGNYKSKTKRACSRIDKKRDLTSKFLYCGSRKQGLQERYIQHLGYGSQNTYALQLWYWSKKCKLELEFHYAWLDPKYIEFTELIESSLTSKIKPLFGK